MSEPGLLNGRHVTFADSARGRAARTQDQGSLRARLAHFSLAEARLRTKLLLAFGSLDLPGDTGALLTKARFGGGPDADVWMLFKSSNGVIGVAPRTFNGRMVAWLPSDVSPDLPEAIGQVAAFEFVIMALERQCGGLLAPVGLGLGPPHRLRLDLFDAPGGPLRHSLYIAVDEAAALAWPAVESAVTAVPRPLRGLRVRCEMGLAGPRTSRAEAALLEVGDIIVMPSPSLGLWPALINIRSAGSILSGQFDVAHSRFILRSSKAVPMEDVQAPPLVQFLGVPSPSGAAQVDDGTAQDPLGQAESKDDIGPLLAGLPVQLQLCIGELELSLGELAALAPGAILDIPSRGEDLRVNVMAEKVRIATGLLVALGQGYGVLVETVSGGE